MFMYLRLRTPCVAGSLIYKQLLPAFYLSFTSAYRTSAQAAYQFERKQQRDLMDVHQISDRIQLHRTGQLNELKWSLDTKRVLVILFPWLGAKEKHIERYRKLYTDLGLDVLTVKSSLTDFLWPPNSVRLAKHTLKTLDERFRDYDHFMFHTLSIGSYNLTVLTMIARKLNCRKHLIDKFRGMIFDSIVVGSRREEILKTDDGNEIQAQSVEGIDRMLLGAAKGVSKNSYFQSLVIFLGKMYLSATKKHTLDFYEKALDMARDDPLKVPTLVLASRDDPMSDVNALHKLVDEWQTKSNLLVTLQLWESSPHAQHLMYHQDEYEAAVKSCLNSVIEVAQESTLTGNKSKL